MVFLQAILMLSLTISSRMCQSIVLLKKNYQGSMHTPYMDNYLMVCPKKRDFKYYIAMMFILKKVHLQRLFIITSRGCNMF